MTDIYKTIQEFQELKQFEPLIKTVPLRHLVEKHVCILIDTPNPVDREKKRYQILEAPWNKVNLKTIHISELQNVIQENFSYFVIHIETKEGFKCLNNVFKKLIKNKKHCQLHVHCRHSIKSIEKVFPKLVSLDFLELINVGDESHFEMKVEDHEISIYVCTLFNKIRLGTNEVVDKVLNSPFLKRLDIFMTNNRSMPLIFSNYNLQNLEVMELIQEKPPEHHIMFKDCVLPKLRRIVNKSTKISAINYCQFDSLKELHISYDDMVLLTNFKAESLEYFSIERSYFLPKNVTYEKVQFLSDVSKSINGPDLVEKLGIHPGEVKEISIDGLRHLSFPSLKALKVPKLEYLNFISGIINIEKLEFDPYVDCDNLKELACLKNYKFEHLKTLKLTLNDPRPFRDLPISSENMPNLKNLEISKNYSKTSFYLKEITLNGLKGLDLDRFTTNIALVHFQHLKDCKIKELHLWFKTFFDISDSVPKCVINNHKEIYYPNFSPNPEVAVPPTVSIPSHIAHLKLSTSAELQLTNKILNAPHLESLDISGIKKLTKFTFSSKNLKHLNISGTGLNEIPVVENEKCEITILNECPSYEDVEKMDILHNLKRLDSE
ncbi:unnamed protein product [Wickerhamomyces anomalus]